MLRANTFVTVLVLSFAVSGCSKKSEGPGASASASAAPSASVAAPAGTGGVCPPNSSGKGTAEEPCKGTGRVLEAKWTGKNNKKSVFSVTNKLKSKVDFVQASIYYYDAAGKQLEIPNKDNPKYPHKSASPSGGLFTIGPGETKEIELGFTVDLIPKATKSIELEFNKVGWVSSDPNAKDDVYWENSALAPENRPMGANK